MEIRGNGEPRPENFSIQEQRERAGVCRSRETWPASMLGVEVEAGSVAPYWMVSGARSVGRVGTENTSTEPTWPLVAKKRMCFEDETL